MENEQERIKVKHKLGGTNEVFADTLVPMVDGEVWKFKNIIINSQKETKSDASLNSTDSSPSDTHTKDYGHKDLIYKDYKKGCGKELCQSPDILVCGEDKDLHGDFLYCDECWDKFAKEKEGVK